ncbi:MAG: DUF1552 domain-containing protein [Pseudomonadota bacterium]|nr:MAG: Tat pathway signal sequence [Pseudomonadota bacterium]
MTKHINRRLFLRGLGGAVVAAPFLSSVAEREAKAQSLPASGPPKRLIVMFTHYGCITTKFFPMKSHGALTAADLQGTTLRFLEPVVDKLLLPRGIRAMNEWSPNNTSDGGGFGGGNGPKLGQGNDPHTQVVGSFFTCAPVTPNTNDPFDLGNTAAKFNAKPIAPSLDHVIAKQLSPNGTPLFIRVGNGNDNPQSAISYQTGDGKESPYPGLGVPTQILNSLTGLFGSGGGEQMNPDTYAVIRGKSILDVVKDDLDTLERMTMSSEDRTKLQAWKALLDDTTTVIRGAACSEDTAALIGATAANASAVKTNMPGTDVLSTKINDTLDGADVYMNLAALAAACNANPVIFLKFPGSYVFRGLGINAEAHGLSHRIGNAEMSGACVEGVLGMLQKIDEFYAQKFARLVTALNMIPEGNGSTVLDSTAAIWFQELSDGNAHNLNNLPIVHVGSMGGYFKTGQAVNVWDGSADLHRGDSESQCNGQNNQANGATKGTGTPSNIATAPINKYFVNIMNALGVKGNAQGQPDPNGTGEVFAYGMYDKTEDFFGGGTVEPRITDPGPFDQLKANA